MTASFSARTELAIDIVCQTITFLLICLRIYVSIYYLTGRITLPDIFMVASWVCFLANTLTDFFSYKMGMWDPRIHYTADGRLPPYDEVMDPGTMKKAFVLMYITASAYYVSLYFIKMTFLFLYRQIFPVDMKKLRFAVNFMIGIVTAGYGVVVGMMFFWSLPVSRNWTMNPEDTCLTWAAVPPYFFGTGFHVITDLLVYALPFSILPRLNNSCSRRKFAGVVAMFSLGLVCILCTVARIVNAGMDSSAEVIAVWCTAEITASTITACILPIKRLWDVSHGNKRGTRVGEGAGGEKVVREAGVGVGRGGRVGARAIDGLKDYEVELGRRIQEGIEGGDGSKMWTRGDVDTIDTAGRETVFSGVEVGLAPRKSKDTVGNT